MKSYATAGIGCILLPGVSLNEGCVVGAGAVVTKDIPAYSVAVGIPARVIKVLSKPGEREKSKSDESIKL
jgi:acetyltransferase-like isoleucine patch superfamily enzyme